MPPGVQTWPILLPQATVASAAPPQGMSQGLKVDGIMTGAAPQGQPCRIGAANWSCRAQLQKNLEEQVRQNGGILLNILEAQLSVASRSESRLAIDQLRANFRTQPSLKAAFLSLPEGMQSQLRGTLGGSQVDRALALSESADPEEFYSGLLNLAQQLRRQGQNSAAYIVLEWLSESPDKNAGGIPSEVRRKAVEARDVFRGKGSLGLRVESFFSEPLLLTGSRTFQAGGSILGMAGIACSWFQPLRPFSAGILHLLSRPQISGFFLLSGSYLLVHDAPMVFAATRRLLRQDYQGSNDSAVSDFLSLSGFSIAALGLGVGFTSFAVGGRSGWKAGSALFWEGGTLRQAYRVGAIRGDAVRRAVMEPEIWVNNALGNPNLSTWQRNFLERGGVWTNRLLLKGSAAVGLARFAWGLKEMNDSSKRAAFHTPGFGDLLLGLALDVFPAVNLRLYRAGRGDRRFGVGPTVSQELQERHYSDPKLRTISAKKIREGVGSLGTDPERDFNAQAQSDLAAVEKLLKDAKALPVLGASSSHGGPRQAVWSSWVNESVPPPISKIPTSQPPKSFMPQLQLQAASAYDLGRLRIAYEKMEFTPVDLLKYAMGHHAAQHGSLFPRPIHKGSLRTALLNLAEESRRRFATGRARPLEGVLIAVKDIFPGVDGQMGMGSKTAAVVGIEPSPVVQRLLELGAIPIPVGMTAQANGGSGMYAGFGYIPHPNRVGFDPAGSSSGPAHLIGLKDFPVNLGVGTDTGGSITAPAGAVGLFGFVPPAGIISTKNMVPFATFLDRVGVLAGNPRDGMRLARLLSHPVGDDPHMPNQNPQAQYYPAVRPPKIAYLADLLKEVSPDSRSHFLAQMDKYRRRGTEVIPLDSSWNFLAEVPLKLYPLDAYGAAVFTHANPLQNRRMDPPRRTLDENLSSRLPKGVVSLERGYFDRAREASRRYLNLVRSKLGEGVVLASPAPESIPTETILLGKAGQLLDLHDKITMAKNRIPEWGQVTIPKRLYSPVGISISGSLPDLAYFNGELKSRQLAQHIFRAEPFTLPPPALTPRVPDQSHELN